MQLECAVTFSIAREWPARTTCEHYRVLTGQHHRRSTRLRYPTTENSWLRSNGHTGCAFEFAPADPGAFDGAQDCFPDAVTEHRPIDQAHW